MRYSIREGEGRLVLKIDEVRGHERALVDKIRECRLSAWACPSGACLNIGSIEERIEGGTVFLTLTPRHQMTLDRVGVAECLQYMLAQVVEG